MDPGETKNLVPKHLDLVQQLSTKAIGWYHSMPPGKGSARSSRQ
jgi:hypothetical protein